MGPPPLEFLFNPKSIAVFGASATGGSVGAKVFSNILEGGFEGPIIPINPKHQKVRGKTCYRSIKDVEQQVDLAVIATPPGTVASLIRQCGEAGVGNAIVLSAGFDEVGSEVAGLERKLVGIARRNGVRLLGPNSVGLVRPWIGMNASFLRSNTPKGGLALISQSGALCSAIADWAGPNHLGFSAIVSTGSSVDIDFGEAMEFLANDPKTDAILLYVEGIRNARSFISALRSAGRMKPVIVLKSGRYAQSSKAAFTHTGALMGSDVVFDAALERGGAVRAATFGQLFSAAEMLGANQRSGGNRLGIITNGGGAGVLAADRAGDLNIDLAAPSDKTIAALDKLLPKYWSKGNPIDILGDAKPEHYAAALTAGMNDPNFDGLLVMLTPQAVTEASQVAQAVIGAGAKKARKPILACWMGETSVRAARETLSSNGIPDFTTPERAVEAFSYLAQHHGNRRLALEIPGPLPDDLQPPDIEGARMIIEAALAEGRNSLSDIEAKAVMRSFRIPMNTALEADSATRALIAAETVGFPVAMKINSPQIPHKSDVGGVRINILNAADVKLAFRDIVDVAKAVRPKATILGVTVEQMAHVEDARELLIGASRDPVFGPSIMFGAGGTMVEILRDSAVSLPPLNAVLANRLINRTKVSNLLDAFRDRAAVDRAAVTDVLLRVSDMVCELPEVQELEINPLLAGPNGVIAVDARIRIARKHIRSGPYDHMAIAPYPRHLVQQGHLPDGTPLTIRPIRAEDAESEQTFVRELSPEARQFRFMGTVKELSAQMLAQFTQIDYAREMALVAVTDTNGKPGLQGVAQYFINPDRKSCEFAIVVSDKLQGQGIGTRLMKALMDAARQHALEVIEGSVLLQNTGMLRLMKELGFSAEVSSSDRDVMMVERQL